MLTVPTLLTLARLVVLPLLLWLLFIGHVGAALGLYILGAITDFLDGYLARKLNQITAFGTFLDPIADKVYVCALFIALVATGQIAGLSLAAVIIILSREFLVSGLREYLGPKNVKLPVSKLAKWKTAAQMVATAFLIVAGSAPFAAEIGTLLLWIAAALTVITGTAYMKTGLSHMDSAS